MPEFRDPESSIVTFVWYRPVPPSKATTAPHCSPGSGFDTCCAHMAAGEGTTLGEKSIHHRPLRDTTASTSSRRVLTSPPSVDGQATRAELTMRYAQAGIDMKRQALEQVFPDVMSSAKDQTIIALMAGCLAGCTACRRSVMWSCIAGSRASWALRCQLNISPQCTLSLLKSRLFNLRPGTARVVHIVASCACRACPKSSAGSGVNTVA